MFRDMEMIIYTSLATISVSLYVIALCLVKISIMGIN